MAVGGWLTSDRIGGMGTERGSHQKRGASRDRLTIFPYSFPALENKSKSAEKKTDSLLKEKKRLETDLDTLSRKTHDASGQLVLISQELLKKERSVFQEVNAGVVVLWSFRRALACTIHTLNVAVGRMPFAYPEGLSKAPHVASSGKAERSS